MIEIVRAPLLGTVPAGMSFAVSGATALVLTGMAYASFRIFRRRIAYWL